MLKDYKIITILNIILYINVNICFHEIDTKNNESLIPVF